MDSKGRNITFAFGILDSYSYQEISWFLESFKKINENKQPYTCLCDYNYEVLKAAKDQLEDSRVFYNPYAME